MVHKKELIRQTSKTLSSLGIKHGFIASQFEDNSHPVKLVSIQTYAKRKRFSNLPDIIIIDEAHHARANSYQKLPQVPTIGLSATPVRLGGRGLFDVFDYLILGPSVKELIDRKFLAPYSYKLPNLNKLDLKGVKKTNGDYVISELEEKLNKKEITGSAIDSYNKWLKGKKAIVFTVNINHSIAVCKAFNEAGIRARHVDGKTPQKERDQIFEDFGKGEFEVLVNCNLVSEGVDVPDCDGAILLRPTDSLALFIQQVGRALRFVQGKIAVIIDHVGNVFRHMPPDYAHDWLEIFYRDKKIKSGSSSGPSYKGCKHCFSLIESFKKVCPICGGDVAPQVTRHGVKQVDGELIDLEDANIQFPKSSDKTDYLTKNLGFCVTKEEFVNIALKVNYKKNNGYMWYTLYKTVRSHDLNAMTFQEYNEILQDSKIPFWTKQIYWKALVYRKRNTEQITFKSELQDLTSLEK